MQEQNKKQKEQEANAKKEEKKESVEQQKLLALEKEKVEMVDTLQRLQAEFENYKKRIEKEAVLREQFGKAKAIAEILPLLDSFDAAEEKLKKEHKQDNGLELLHKQFLQSMQRLGLQEVKALGETFNHETMDCMMQGNDASKPEGIVLEEFQKGYLLDARVLRHAKVKVNRHAEQEKSEEKKETEKKNCV